MFRLAMAESVLAGAKSEPPSSGESSSIESSEAIMDPDKMQKVVEITRTRVPVLEDFAASVLKDMRHEYKHDSRSRMKRNLPTNTSSIFSNLDKPLFFSGIKNKKPSRLSMEKIVIGAIRQLTFENMKKKLKEEIGDEYTEAAEDLFNRVIKKAKESGVIQDYKRIYRR